MTHIQSKKSTSEYDIVEMFAQNLVENLVTWENLDFFGKSEKRSFFDEFLNI
jgi:hypothetical protein